MEGTVAPSDSPRLPLGYQEFVVRLLSDREHLFLDVVQGTTLGRTLWYVLATIIGGAALYGVSAGAYSSVLQAASAAVKLPLLILATFAICFPAFFVVQILVGSRLRLLQALVYARHVEDPVCPVAGGVNIWGESPLCVNPVNVVRHGHRH